MPVPRSEQRCRCSRSNAFFATERLSLEKRATRSVGIGADLARLGGGVGGEAALGDGHAHLGSTYVGNAVEVKVKSNATYLGGLALGCIEAASAIKYLV